VQSRSLKFRQSLLPGAAQEKVKSMYAVVRTGGKQYKVAAGDSVEVEKLAGNIGDSITLGDVLLVAAGDTVTVGTPTVGGATVTAKITGQYRGTKIMVFKYRPKKRIRVRRGHRQYLTRLQIEAVNA
jgi:large subunit ribosomal protein L21